MACRSFGLAHLVRVDFISNCYFTIRRAQYWNCPPGGRHVRFHSQLKLPFSLSLRLSRQSLCGPHLHQTETFIRCFVWSAGWINATHCELTDFAPAQPNDYARQKTGDDVTDGLHAGMALPFYPETVFSVASFSSEVISVIGYWVFIIV